MTIAQNIAFGPRIRRMGIDIDQRYDLHTSPQSTLTSANNGPTSTLSYQAVVSAMPIIALSLRMSVSRQTKVVFAR